MTMRNSSEITYNTLLVMIVILSIAMGAATKY